MPASQFVVNYSAASGRVRSWVVFDAPNETDAQLASFLVGPGEAQARFAVGQYGDLNTIQALVNSVTGMDPDQPPLTASKAISSGAMTTGADTAPPPSADAPPPAADAYDCWDADGNYVVTASFDPDGCGDKPAFPATQFTPATQGAGPGWTLVNGSPTAPLPSQPMSQSELDALYAAHK